MQKKIIVIGNWISYLFFLGVWLTAYIFYQAYELLALLVVMLALVPVSIGAVYYLRRKLQISCSVRRKQAEKDQSFLVDFVVNNPTILVSRNVILTVDVENTFVGEPQRQYMVIPLKAKGEKKVCVECKGIYCGMMQFHVVQCELRDWLGLTLLKREINVKTDIAIMPNVKSVNIDYEHMGRGEGEQERRTLSQKGDDVSEITQIREYEPGDRLQNIHWKLSSKSESFLVKDYSMPVNHEITLLLDFRRTDDKYVEKEQLKTARYSRADRGNSVDNTGKLWKLDDVLELFFSVILFLCQEGQEMYVCWVNGEELEEEHISSKEQWMSLIFKIYEGKPNQGEISAYDYYSRLYAQSLGNTMYFCRKDALPQGGEYEQEMQIEAGEAVAVWL